MRTEKLKSIRTMPSAKKVQRKCTNNPYYCTKRKMFVCGSKRYVGIHKLLKKSFYPTDTGKRVGCRCSLPPSAAMRRGVGVDAKLLKHIKSGRTWLPTPGSSASGDYLLRLLDKLRVWKLLPVRAQLGVSDDKQGVATALDLLCSNSTVNYCHTSLEGLRSLTNIKTM
jgi:hypothetical protein